MRTSECDNPNVFQKLISSGSGFLGNSGDYNSLSSKNTHAKVSTHGIKMIQSFGSQNIISNNESFKTKQDLISDHVRNLKCVSRNNRRIIQSQAPKEKYIRKDSDERKIEKYLRINQKKNQNNQKDNDIFIKSLDLLKAYGELDNFQKIHKVIRKKRV